MNFKLEPRLDAGALYQLGEPRRGERSAAFTDKDSGAKIIRFEGVQRAWVFRRLRVRTTGTALCPADADRRRSVGAYVIPGEPAKFGRA